MEDNMKAHYRYLKEQHEPEPIRLLASGNKGRTGIWYGHGYDCYKIILTNGDDEKMIPKKSDTLILISDLLRILGEKSFDIIEPLYVCEISPEEKEFYDIMDKILKDVGLDKLLTDNGDEEFVRNADNRKYEINKYFPTVKSIIKGSMILARAHFHADLHSDSLGDLCPDNMWVDIKYVMRTDLRSEGNIVNISRMKEKYRRKCECQICTKKIRNNLKDCV